MKAYEFFRGDFSRYPPRSRNGLYARSRYQRTSLLMQRVVGALTKHLYARGPARSIPDAEPATLWLNEQYSREGIDSILQEADRLASVGDVAAIQVEVTDDPERPVRFLVWPAHQFVVFESEQDPTVAEAVATIDFFDQRRRCRLWTAELVQEFRTNKGDQTSGGTAFYPVGVPEDNPLGRLPFGFVHFHPPNTCFWGGGPGDHLTEANDYLNFFLTEMGDSVRYCMKPIVKSFGIREGWTPPGPVDAGDIWTPPPAYTDVSGNGIPPEMGYLQPDPSFIEGGWADAQSYIDHTLECNDCPPAEIRMEQSGASSGIAILFEQLPLVIRATGRQRAAGRYEKDLARITLAAGGIDPKAASGLTLRWPSMLPDIPGAGAAQDLEDEQQLKTGQTSRVQIAMRRFNFTREQAIEHLRQIAEDLALETAMGLPNATGSPVEEPALVTDDQTTDRPEHEDDNPEDNSDG